MSSSSHHSWISRLTTVLIALGCIVLIGSLQWPQLRQLQTKSQTAPVETIRQDAEAEKLRLDFLQKVPSFGFDNLLANWTFLRFLQYFGDQAARQKTDYSLSPDYFEVILGRDPYFIQTYPFLSTSASIYAGLPERSTALIQTSLQSLKPNVPPGSYVAWRQLAIDQLLFTGDAEAARQSFLNAAEWADQSTDPDSQAVAQFSRQTANFLATNPDSKTAQVSAWIMVLSNAPDDRTRQTAVQRIEALGGKIIEQPDGTFQVQGPPED
jgi:type IV secretory pathway TrbF-like protein